MLGVGSNIKYHDVFEQIPQIVTILYCDISV